MTLRGRLIITVAVASLLSAAVFSGSLLYLTRTTLSFSESRTVERGIEIGVAAARGPAESAEALRAFRAYRQLQAVRGLVEQRVAIAGLLFGLVVFGLSLAASSVALLRLTRPLNQLTAALNRAGQGDLEVKVKAASQDEVGTAGRAFNTMTDRLRQLQEDLRRSERLAAWRDVARILGHEVRNPLTPIRLSVERIQLKARNRSADLESVVESSTRTIVEEIEALDRLVREFSEFARLPSPELRPAPLNHLLSETVSQYELATPGIRFDSRLDPAVDPWSLDPELMRRAFTNIIKNSVEALTDAATPSPAIAVATELRAGRCLVTFEDNGPGVPADIAGRLFDPYVTTKAKGTGLGLAVVRNIVTDHGGKVEIESSARGTKVTISLPKGGKHES